MREKINDLIQLFCEALSIEANYEKEQGGKPYRLFNMQCLGKDDGGWIYIFESEVELFLPDGLPIRIEKFKKFYGEILACSGYELVLLLKTELIEAEELYYLYCEPWEILLELQRKLINLSETPNFGKLSLAYQAVCASQKLVNQASQKLLHKGQEKAIQFAQDNPVSFIWGPPGTGKTETLAKIAFSHYKNGKTVLILSHSNVAVDTAIERIDRIYQNEYQPGEIVRYGYPRINSVRSHSYLTTYKLVLNNNPDLKRRVEELRKIIEKLKNDINVRNTKAKIDKELHDVNEEIKEKEREIINNSKIIATTLSKATIDTTISNILFDAVLLDEASMAYIPQSFYAASLARKNITYFGDFLQLPPIVQKEDDSKVENWLMRDIFEQAGIKHCLENETYHPLMVLLDVQRRMDPKISTFINCYIYKDLLNDSEDIIQKTKPIVEREPFRKRSFVSIDLTPFPSICHQDGSYSRYNIFSAFFSVLLALSGLLDQNDSIGIITPYSTQSKLLRSILQDLMGKDLRNSPIYASTVHQFQGSERDIIIFDTVDSYRLKRPGILLTRKKNDNALRLINVAVSRAKGKFILISKQDYWSQRLNSNMTLFHLFKYSKDILANMENDQLLDFIRNLNLPKKYQEVIKVFLGTNIDELIKEIEEAQESIYCSIPDSFQYLSQNWIEAISEALSRNVDLQIRTENPNRFPLNWEEYIITDSFAWTPVIIIDKKITWFGFPKIDSNDSVNILIRFKGEKTAKTILSLMQVKITRNSVSDKNSRLAMFIIKNFQCPECNKNLSLIKNSRGNPFLGCSSYPECNFTQPFTVEILNSYIQMVKLRCSRCGSRMRGSRGKYGFFVGCSSYPQCREIISIWKL